MSGSTAPNEQALQDLFPATGATKDGRAFSVTLYTPADYVSLEEFYVGFEPKRCAQGLPPIGRERIARWLRSVLASGAHLIARMDGELVGHGLLVPTSGRADVWEWAIFLAADHRGRGMGTEMNRLAVAAGRALDLRGLWLSVEPHNRAALRSYEKAGFRFSSTAFLSPEAEMELEYQQPVAADRS
jgi:RimJ/RimL family protein N-acetyltransferase